MSKILIKGGNRLTGTVKIQGAKNSALPIMAAMLMLPGENSISNIPHLVDVITMSRVLRSLGLRSEYSEPHSMKTWNNGKIKYIAHYDLVTKLRASFFVAGPLLAINQMAKIPMPGGCAIGLRPIDLHVKGFKALGAKVEIEHGFVDIRANKLKGAEIILDFPSVGATENIMMAATLAEGTTIIENAAREPEVIDLGNFLNATGAKIINHGTSTIEIQGVSSLKSIKNYRIIPDRIEAGTMLVAGAITKGDVIVQNINIEHLKAIIDKLEECGCQIDIINEHSLHIKRSGKLLAVDTETLPYPGFPTDMQAQMMSLLTLAQGTSVITETVFENRFLHTPELQRMGANIKISERNAIIHGVSKLTGAPVKASDLRAGAALILSALAAEGESLLYGMKYVDRGYENIVGKLNSLGADIQDV